MTAFLAATAAASIGPGTATLAKSTPRSTPATCIVTCCEGFRLLLLYRRKDLQGLKTKGCHFVLHLIPHQPHLFLRRRDFSLIRIRLQPEFPQFITLGNHRFAKRFNILEMGIPQFAEFGLLIRRQIQFAEPPKIPSPAGSVTGTSPRADGQGSGREQRRNEQHRHCHHHIFHLCFSFLLLRMVVLVLLS
jgi:hypothetical protein